MEQYPSIWHQAPVLYRPTNKRSHCTQSMPQIFVVIVSVRHKVSANRRSLMGRKVTESRSLEIKVIPLLAFGEKSVRSRGGRI
ncbi:hypothetical protein Q3G72_024503 [Acer saccharum]|nr:hypothetical protein Q3G72_024503 [Acer saccharum]